MSLSPSAGHETSMKPESLVIVLVWMTMIWTPVTSGGKSAIRRRRDLLDLADMFDLLTGLDPTEYIPYGNWCGYGGKGNAVDRIDECCQVHDSCYGVSEESCSAEQIHVVPYVWRIHNGTIICDDEETCPFSVCSCDREVVECIVQHNHTYNEDYRFIRKYRR